MSPAPPTPVPLPSNVGFGRIEGRFLLAVADGSDAGSDPDGLPATGQVEVTPSPKWLLNATASPKPAIIIPKTIPCGINSDGDLTDPMGNVGVSVLSTDDPDNNPSDWTYLVTVKLDGITPWSFSIHVPTGATVNLATVSPVNASAGNAVIVGPAGPAGPQGPPGEVTASQLADAVAAEASDRADADAAHEAAPNPHPQYVLDTDAIGRFCSTDGTFGLPAPTGVRGEFVITTTGGVPGLADIRYNGTSL